jgi:hypothetical protein
MSSLLSLLHHFFWLSLSQWPWADHCTLIFWIPGWAQSQSLLYHQQVRYNLRFLPLEARWFVFKIVLWLMTLSHRPFAASWAPTWSPQLVLVKLLFLYIYHRWQYPSWMLWLAVSEIPRLWLLTPQIAQSLSSPACMLFAHSFCSLSSLPAKASCFVFWNCLQAIFFFEITKRLS